MILFHAIFCFDRFHNSTYFHIFCFLSIYLQCDVVVNEIIENLDLSNSPISEIAGPGLEKSLKQAVSGEIGYGQIAVTGNADLKNCKAVYHGVMPLFTDKTRSDCKGVRLKYI